MHPSPNVGLAELRLPVDEIRRVSQPLKIVKFKNASDLLFDTVGIESGSR